MDADLRVWNRSAEFQEKRKYTDQQLALPHEETMKLFARSFMSSANPSPQYILLANSKEKEYYL